MAHVKVEENAFGIVSLLMAYPDTAAHLGGLAEALLRNGTPMFNKAEREGLASYVSYLNGCVFCSESHAAAADAQWGVRLAKSIWESLDDAPIKAHFRALLAIAKRVQKNDPVTTELVQKAKDMGVTDRDIHDAVLIAAAFCMYNRYVDGLATTQPRRGDPYYEHAGQMLAKQGYLQTPWE